MRHLWVRETESTSLSASSSHRQRGPDSVPRISSAQRWLNDRLIDLLLSRYPFNETSQYTSQCARDGLADASEPYVPSPVLCRLARRLSTAASDTHVHVGFLQSYQGQRTEEEWAAREKQYRATEQCLEERRHKRAGRDSNRAGGQADGLLPSRCLVDNAFGRLVERAAGRSGQPGNAGGRQTSAQTQLARRGTCQTT